LIGIVSGDELISILTLDGDGSRASSRPGNDLSNLDGNPNVVRLKANHDFAGSIYYRIEIEQRRDQVYIADST